MGGSTSGVRCPLCGERVTLVDAAGAGHAEMDCPNDCRRARPTPWREARVNQLVAEVERLLRDEIDHVTRDPDGPITGG